MANRNAECLASRCSVVLEKKKSAALGNHNRAAEIKCALCCSQGDELQHNRLVKMEDKLGGLE